MAEHLESAIPPPERVASRRQSVWLTRIALLLEVLIAGYALALLTIVLFGGVRLSWISATRPEKPFLMLLVLIPIRLAISVRSPCAVFFQPAVARLRPAIEPIWQHVHVSERVRDVAWALLITRPASFAVAFLINILVPPRGFRSFRMPFGSEKWFEIFAAWDSAWYFDIAKHGYRFNPDSQSSVAFFPLYPMLIRLVAWPFGSSDRAIWLSGIGISWVSFGLALLLLHRLTEQLFGSRETARRAVVYVAVFPFSFFFTRVYAESLFLLLSLLAVVGAIEGRWTRAALWGGLAALARPNGILIGVPLGLLALKGDLAPRYLMRRTGPLMLVPCAVLGYCAYVYILAGNPFAWLDAQRHWYYTLGNAPWAQLLKLVGGLMRHGFYDFFFTSKLAAFQLFHGTIALVFLTIVPFVFRDLGGALGTYVLVSLLLPLTGSDLQGLGRYSAVLFPVFMVAARRSGGLHEAILIVSALCLAMLVGLFVTLHPVF